MSPFRPKGYKKSEFRPNEQREKEDSYENNVYDSVPKQIAIDDKMQTKQRAQRNKQQKRFGTAQLKTLEQPFESLEITDYCSLNKEDENTPLVIDEALET